jgi:hypothetical protein
MPEELNKLDEYILSISLREYLEFRGQGKGRFIGDFELVNVDAATEGGGAINKNTYEQTVLEAKKLLYEKGQKLGAEAIVNYRVSIGYDNPLYAIYASGTAVIHKERSSKQ